MKFWILTDLKQERCEAINLHLFIVIVWKLWFWFLIWLSQIISGPILFSAKILQSNQLSLAAQVIRKSDYRWCAWNIWLTYWLIQSISCFENIFFITTHRNLQFLVSCVILIWKSIILSVYFSLFPILSWNKSRQSLNLWLENNNLNTHI